MAVKLQRLYAFIASDGEGNEGLMAAPATNGLMPMIVTDWHRVESLIPLADRIAQRQQISYVIRHFGPMATTQPHVIRDATSAP